MNTAGAWVRTLALVAIGSHTLGCSAGLDAGETTASEGEATATYDNVAKPIPTAFLSKKMNATLSNGDAPGNHCCTGTSASGYSCTNNCADSNGLITSAGVAKAADYYKATDQDSLTTFDKWKNYYGFPKRRPGESIDAYRKRANVVVYYNRTELALGRELGCSQNSNGIACYVSNYGDHFASVADWRNPDADSPDGSNGLKDAMYGKYTEGFKRKNTVVISYDPRREYNADDGRAVQFAAFGGDGNRLDKAQLDTMGARPIPQICTTCHGGVWDADTKTSWSAAVVNGIARYARFLPLITSTVTFSNQAPYRQQDQEEQIRVVNEFAWKARGNVHQDQSPTTGGSLTERQTWLMGWLYNASAGNTPMEGTLSFYRPDGVKGQYWEYAWPGGWSGTANQNMYNFTVLPFCDTCHMAMDPIPAGVNSTRQGQSGITYNLLKSFSDTVSAKNTFAAFMGVSSSGFGSRSSMLMPHAQNAFARFWGDPIFDSNCNYGGSSRVAGDCFLNHIGVWSGGRPAGADFARTNLSSLVPSTSASQECGLGNATSTSSTTGVDAGRRLASVVLGSTIVTQCADGCTAGSYCGGTETVYNSSSNRFPGVRQECRPFSSASNYGNCVQCGRLYQVPCQQVGSTCNTTLNPNCTSLPACHEGTSINGRCEDTVLSQGKTATQSSTAFGGSASRAVDGNADGNWNNGSVTHTSNSSAPWWKVDLGSTKKVSWIDIYNRTDCCYDRLKNFVVEYSTDNVNFTVISGGDFTGVSPVSSSMFSVVPPKAVDARYVRIRLLAADYLSLGEVFVRGW